MLRFYTPPYSMRSAHDIVGATTAKHLTFTGINTSAQDLWPDTLAYLLECRGLPLGRTIFRKVFAAPMAKHSLSTIKAGDVAWILGFAAHGHTHPVLETELKQRRASYMFHIMDDWFSEDYLREGTLLRARLADLIIVPTPELVKRVQQEVPETPVIRLEEPIDTNRVRPLNNPNPDLPPLVVWCGNPGQLFRLTDLLEQLNQLHKKSSFRFRIICNKRPTSLALNFPWEWYSYDYQRESELLAGACAGLAPLQDTPYTRCKGAYKCKTYMAAGIPVVASRVGYQVNLIRDSVDGFLIDTEQPDQWFTALSSLIQDDQLQTKMATACRKQAVDCFSHQAVLPDWQAQLTTAFPRLASDRL